MPSHRRKGRTGSVRLYGNIGTLVGRGRTPPLRRSYKRCGTERAVFRWCDGAGRSPLRMDLGPMQPGRCGERAERRQWRMKRSERVAAVKISSVRRKAAQKFWVPQQDHRPLRRFSLTKSSERPILGRSGDLGFNFYFLALLSTTSRSRAVKSSRDMAPRSPSTRCRGETVPFSMSRSPTTTM